MNKVTRSLYLAAAICVLSLGLIGCSFLRPSGVTPRLFVLIPLSEASPAEASGSTPVTVGIGYVRIPTYLSKKNMVMRQDSHEITYLETMLWAERLDIGLQRVTASNLAALLPSAQIRTTVWRTGEVSAEVFVNVEQFDVDRHGKCVLTATWRILAASGEKVLASGKFSKSRDGAPPDSDPREAVQSMSSLAADLCQELARSVKPH